MELRQMQYFLCLADEKNVTRAARRLNIVQPALSMQIAKLEVELGQRLFDRSVQGMTLTSAGEALVRLTAPIVRDAEYARQEMAQIGGRISGRVAVGLITSVAQSTMASSSATVARRYPEIILSACEGYTETLVDWVNSGQLDFALINVPRRRTPLAAHHIMDEEMVFACRKDGPIRPAAKLRFDHIANFDLVLPSKRHGLRLILDEHAAALGIDLRPRLELDTLPALCDVIATTDFATVLPTIALRQSLASGTTRAHRFDAQRIVRSIAWVHHPRRAVSVAAKAVLDVISHDLAQAAAVAKQLAEPGSGGAASSSRKQRRKTGKTIS
ncbi:LysR family nitrogen assimilation transcriptional regulator [Bradyrhizobium ottawaense]|uniref:LysR family nitrogen assimilation transcriptional regulator n=2 Tax=Nitrobacteraceae TaxID=41294 RepID=A0ABV4FYS5_9BRAD|nr:transcriptional regulator [Bradyrhizobium ottawaense]GMO21746.1 LysR family transcriptional regulator [Bradyrhizobium ottawaense]GMO26935.1 LysR family transcriptional regulator [Bradyrhizobium ottawaense]GMO36535.1 LysR family transcriptional regulator [Bradyrhizobium ottawaense]GMO59246.1 LysR family transcriptional regulator [Bradyrhizobium ottawaense]